MQSPTHSESASWETNLKVCTRSNLLNIISKAFVETKEIIVVWIRFLALLPSLPFHGKPRWRRSGVVLKWLPTQSSNKKSTSELSRQVTLICFQPVEGIIVAINRLFKSSSWEDALRDPYFLINASFETWHQLVDENAWKLVDLSRETERVGCTYSRSVANGSRLILTIDRAYSNIRPN